MREMRAVKQPRFAGHAFGVRVQRVQKVQKGMLTGPAGPKVMAACQRRVV